MSWSQVHQDRVHTTAEALLGVYCTHVTSRVTVGGVSPDVQLAEQLLHSETWIGNHSASVAEMGWPDADWITTMQLSAMALCRIATFRCFCHTRIHVRKQGSTPCAAD